MNLVKLDIVKPDIPQKWDYDKSVDKVNNIQYKYKNLHIELINELLIAREKLSADIGKRTRNASGTLVPMGKTWSDYCGAIGSSRQVVNRWLKQWFSPATEPKQLEQPELPEGFYNVIYADPPWQYDFSETQSREIENNYPTMTVEKICNLEIPASENSVLFLWATAPKIREALEVMNAWEFEYKTHSIWDKEIIGMGYWFRGQHELLMIGTKGSCNVPEEKIRVSSVYKEKRGKHSEKPLYYYDLIEKYFPDGKYLELFARKKHNDKWTVWGNERI